MTTGLARLARRLLPLAATWLRRLRRPPPPSTSLTPASQQSNKRAALMLVYSGTGYRGMQRQVDAGPPTIEGVLLDCLLAAGRIRPEQLERGPGRLQLGFGCVSKTDRGVSALAQVWLGGLLFVYFSGF